MSMYGRVVAVAASTAVLAGCSGGEVRGPSSVTVTVTESATATTTVSVPGQALTANPRKLGESYRAGPIELTVREIKRFALSGSNVDDLKGPDESFWGVSIRACPKEVGPFGWLAWTIIGADGGNYVTTNGRNPPAEFPRPVYPEVTGPQNAVPVGECRTGWIVAPVKNSTTPLRVAYRSSDGQAQQWAVD